MGDQEDNNEEATDDTAGEPPTGGSGRGDALGAPSSDWDEAPPSSDQEANEVVSGGGLVGPNDDEPSGNDGEPSDAARS